MSSIQVPEFIEQLVSNPELDSALRQRIEAALSLIRRHNEKKCRTRTPPPTRSVARVPSAFTLTWRDPSARQVAVRGTFTNPPWNVEISAVRDATSKVFKADLSNLIIGPGTYLYKFIVDGKWRVDPRQPTQLDRDGVLNNVIFFNQSVRPLRPVMSAPNVLAEAAPHQSIRPPLLDTRLMRHRTLHNVHGSLSPTAFRSAEVAGPSKRTSGLRLHAGAWMIPHPDKPRSADAMFFAPNAAGVSDSVGEWEWRFKLDPQTFAEQLMHGCKEVADEMLPGCGGDPDGATTLGTSPVDKRARAALGEAFRKTTAFGSATACVGFLNQSGDALGVANLGDSAFLQFRKEIVVSGSISGASCLLKTKEQQHTFNMPYQLTRLPAVSEFDALANEPGLKFFIDALRSIVPANPRFSETDQPDSADTYFCPLEEGDLVIFASDGLLDNLWLVQVTAIVSTCVSPYEARASAGLQDADDGEAGVLQATLPEVIARRIAEEAYEVSVKRSGLSSQTPFGYNSRRHNHRMAHAGGKPDDITVVAAWVVRSEDLPDSGTSLTSAEWNAANSPDSKVTS